MQIARKKVLLCCQLSQGTFLPAESKDEFLQMHISIKQKQAHRQRTDLGLPRERRAWEGRMRVWG